MQEETTPLLQFGEETLAVVDIWLLSFCDQIFSSALSSFGGMAAAIAGVKPVALLY